MREGLRRRAETEKIAFFCECADSGCYQAIWLTGSEYDRARIEPGWAALLPGHRADVAVAAGQAEAAAESERGLPT